MSEPEAPLLPPELLRTMDPACDAFETAWKEGRQPAIEDYLGTVADSVQPLLLAELVRLELEWRCRRGDQPTVEEYRDRFAACADTVATWLTEARAAVQTLTVAALADTTDQVALATPNTYAPAEQTSGAMPRRVREYELLEQLGAGGMGEVYRARHKRLDKLVALKVLLAHSQDSAARTARFLREIKAVGSLDHPNVVEAHDAGEHGGVAYLVMKLIEGQDLAQVMKKRGPLRVAEACDLARQTALGLQYLHERGLIHRDLKPSNLMRTPDGTVKILDLGLARWRLEGKATDDLTASGQVMGTPDYQAPEQALSATTVDIRADLYALGATLFFLLTGRAPFAHHAGLFEKLTAHQTEAPPDVRQFRPEVPAALADLVGRLLAKKPADRPQSPAEVAAALAVFASFTAPARATPAPPRSEATITLPGRVSPTPTPATEPVTPPRNMHLGLTLGISRWTIGCTVAVAACMLIAVLSVSLALVTSSRPEPTTPPAVAMVKNQDPAPAALPPPPPMGITEGAPKRLTVLSLEVRHFGNVAGQFSKDWGLLGKTSFATRLDDGVTVAAKLPQPAYAFVIAFRPDGTEELCFPEKEDEPPPRTDRPRYPLTARDVTYGLNEGVGLQVFAVVASRQPLPAYKVWRPRCGPAVWKRFPAVPDVVWWDNGDEVAPLTDKDEGQRGTGQQMAGKTPVVELTNWLRRAPEVETAAALGFAVLPKR